MDTTAVASGEPMVQAAGAGLGPWAVWNYGMRYRLQNPAVMTDCRALREATGLNGLTSLAWGHLARSSIRGISQAVCSRGGTVLNVVYVVLLHSRHGAVASSRAAEGDTRPGSARSYNQVTGMSCSVAAVTEE